MTRVSRAENGDGYYGVVAEGYDVYLAGVDFGDGALWPRLLAGTAALELACGTGRVLIPLRAAGHDVEGLDASAEMLAICRAKAAAAGVEVVLHHAGMEAFALGRRYGAIFCPVGSLMLLTAPGAFAAALACAHRHLVPGGLFAASLSRPGPGVAAPGDWRLRRTGQRDGTAYRVRERAMPPPVPGVQRSEMEHTVTRDGVVAHQVKPFDLLMQEPEVVAGALRAAGFDEIELRDAGGTRPLAAEDRGFLALARRPD